MNLKSINNYLNVLREFYTINKSAYRNSKNLDILKRNSGLRGKYSGERAVLLFTGRSVDNINFKLLSNEYVFACNLLALHRDFEDLNADFYSDLDTWSYRLHYFYSIWAMILYAKTKYGTKMFLNASSYDFMKDITGFRAEDTYYMGFNSKFDDASNVSTELDKMTNIITCGCLSANIAISIYMGFKTIYLIGADYTKDPLISGHFYDGVKSLSQVSPELLRRHQIIDEFAKNRGVDIFNVVDEGFTSRTFKALSSHDFVKILK